MKERSILRSGICILLMLVLGCFLKTNLQAQSSKLTIEEDTTLWKKIAPFFSPPEEFRHKYGNYRSPLIFDDGRVIKNRYDWAERREEIKNNWHNMMGRWPPLLKNQRLQFIDSMRRENFTQYKISFQWTPNETTNGYLLVPDGEGKRPAVVTVFYEPETAAGLGTSERTKNTADFAYQLTKMGFITLSLGTTNATQSKTYSIYYPGIDTVQSQPLSMLAYAAANAWYVLAHDKRVDSTRIGIMGLSFGGKWAMFASCLFENYACAVWSDPGIVFDETREAVNYWEPWYLGYHQKPWRVRGRITKENPARGLYPQLRKAGHDLHELHALMAPRPFLVSGGSEDPPYRWLALNHTIAVNKLLGYENRVAMTNRSTHLPDSISNLQAYQFLKYFLFDQ